MEALQSLRRASKASPGETRSLYLSSGTASPIESPSASHQASFSIPTDKGKGKELSDPTTTQFSLHSYQPQYTSVTGDVPCEQGLVCSEPSSAEYKNSDLYLRRGSVLSDELHDFLVGSIPLSVRGVGAIHIEEKSEVSVIKKEKKIGDPHFQAGSCSTQRWIHETEAPPISNPTTFGSVLRGEIHRSSRFGSNRPSGRPSWEHIEHRPSTPHPISHSERNASGKAKSKIGFKIPNWGSNKSQVCNSMDLISKSKSSISTISQNIGSPILHSKSAGNAAGRNFSFQNLTRKVSISLSLSRSKSSPKMLSSNNISPTRRGTINSVNSESYQADDEACGYSKGVICYEGRSRTARNDSGYGSGTLNENLGGELREVELEAKASVSVVPEGHCEFCPRERVGGGEGLVVEWRGDEGHVCTCSKENSTRRTSSFASITSIYSKISRRISQSQAEREWRKTLEIIKPELSSTY